MTGGLFHPLDWSLYPNFTEAEMRCRGTGRCDMDPNFMARLQALRTEYGRPMAVTSGFRAPEYNVRVSESGTSGPHTTGRAVDIAVRGADALDLIVLAVKHGFTGIGVKQDGMGRFVHLDDLPEIPGRPRPTIWSY